MTHRFNKFICKAAKLLILAPSVSCSEKFKGNVYISPILEEYEEDLINRDVADQELLLWQRKWLAVASKDWPDTLAKATKHDEVRNMMKKDSLTCLFC